MSVARYLGIGKPGRTAQQPGEGTAMEQLAMVLGPPQDKFRPPVRMLQPVDSVQTPAQPQE